MVKSRPAAAASSIKKYNAAYSGGAKKDFVRQAQRVSKALP